MMQKSTRKIFRAAALIALSGTALVGLGAWSWCSVIGGCTFGFYEGEIIFVDAVDNSPIANEEVTYYINNGDVLYVNSSEAVVSATDSTGKISVRFERPLSSPLQVLVVQTDRSSRASFRVYPGEMAVDTVISKTSSEYERDTGAEIGRVELNLDIERWSIF